MNTISVATDEAMTKVAVLTPKRDYVWPIDKATTLAAGLRAVAEGKPGVQAGGFIFPVGNLVGLTDQPARIMPLGDDAYQIDAEATYVTTPREAKWLADSLDLVASKQGVRL